MWETPRATASASVCVVVVGSAILVALHVSIVFFFLFRNAVICVSISVLSGLLMLVLGLRLNVAVRLSCGVHRSRRAATH